MNISKQPLSSHTSLQCESPLQAAGKISYTQEKIKTTKPDSALSATSKPPLSETSSEQMMLKKLEFEQLNQEQFLHYASEMEQARSNLIRLLANKTESLAILSKEYLLAIQEGYEQSEMFSLGYDKHKQEAIQESTFVQVNAKQFGIEVCELMKNTLSDSDLSEDRCPHYAKQITEIHFLPIFIQQVSSKSLKSAMITKDDKKRINKQLVAMLESRQVLINSNVRMVKFIVNKYNHHSIAISDLMQEGTIGLIKAVDRFDYQRPVRFSTYAVYWIRQMISRAITKQKKLVPLPFNLAYKVPIVISSINESLQKNNKLPSSTELAEYCQLTVKEVEAILESYKPCISLTSPVNNDEDSAVLLDTLEQQAFKSPLNEIAANNLNKTLKTAINCLQDREAFIIRNRFGINNGIELTLQQIADQYNVSKERIRQIQHTALQKLRKEFGTELSDYLINDPA